MRNRYLILTVYGYIGFAKRKRILSQRDMPEEANSSWLEKEIEIIQYRYIENRKEFKINYFIMLKM